jgi:hypothetical protein
MMFGKKFAKSTAFFYILQVFQKKIAIFTKKLWQELLKYAQTRL